MNTSPARARARLAAGRGAPVRASVLVMAALMSAALAPTAACQAGRPDGGAGAGPGSGAAMPSGPGKSSGFAADGDGDAAPAPTRRDEARVPQVPPPYDPVTPPADAVRTASGLVYKKLTSIDGASQPGQTDTVLVHLTAWRPSSETINDSRVRGQPVPLRLPTVPDGFREAALLLRVGEEAVFWMPAVIGFTADTPAAVPRDQLLYRMQLVSRRPGPVTPPDLARPPAGTRADRAGVRVRTLKAGTGAARPRRFDRVVVRHTAWDQDGRIVESSELGGAAERGEVRRWPDALAGVLTTMAVGQRVRAWLPGAAAPPAWRSRPAPLVVDLELLELTPGQPPPAAPSDVAAAPAGARRSPLGAAFRVLRAGTGAIRPGPDDVVRVHFSAWTPDGELFDTTRSRGEPAEFQVKGVARGWADVLQQMVVGDEVRAWIPAALAYPGLPSRPQGPVVFECELLAIEPAPPAGPGPGSGRP